MGDDATARGHAEQPKDTGEDTGTGTANTGMDGDAGDVSAAQQRPSALGILLIATDATFWLIRCATSRLFAVLFIKAPTKIYVFLTLSCTVLLGHRGYDRINNQLQSDNTETDRSWFFPWSYLPVIGDRWSDLNRLFDERVLRALNRVPGIEFTPEGALAVLIMASGVATSITLASRSRASFSAIASWSALLLAICSATLGTFVYLPFASLVSSPSAVAAWVSGLFVGNIEDFLLVLESDLCFEGQKTPPPEPEGDNGEQFSNTPDCKVALTRYVSASVPFTLARVFALLAAGFGVFGLLHQETVKVIENWSIRHAGSINVVIGDDDTALLLARKLAQDSKRPWRFEAWHKPTWAKATFSWSDLSRILGRPRKTVLIVRDIETSLAREARKGGVIVVDDSPTDAQALQRLLTHSPFQFTKNPGSPFIHQVGRVVAWFFSKYFGRASRHETTGQTMIRLHRMYIVGENRRFNRRVVKEVRKVLAAVAVKQKDSSEKTVQIFPFTTHRTVPRLVLRLDSAREAGKWRTERLLPRNKQVGMIAHGSADESQGVHWLMDALNADEVVAQSIAAKLVHDDPVDSSKEHEPNADEDTSAVARRNGLLNNQSTQRVVLVGSSPLTTALIYEIHWRRWRAFELIRAQIRHCSQKRGNEYTTYQDALESQLRWLIGPPGNEACPNLPEVNVSAPSSLRYPKLAQVPAVKSIRLVGADDRAMHMVRTERPSWRGVKGLDQALTKRFNDAVGSSAKDTLRVTHSDTNRLREEYRDDYLKTPAVLDNGPRDIVDPKGYNLGSQQWIRGMTPEELQRDAEYRLAEMFGLDRSSDHGKPFDGEQVLVVFTEDTTWSRRMADVIMMACGPETTQVVVADGRTRGVHMPDMASGVARCGPTWISQDAPIDDFWVSFARQQHDLQLAESLEKLAPGPSGSVAPSMRRWPTATAGDEDGKEKTDRKEKPEGNDQATSPDDAHNYGEVLPEFFREEYLHELCRLLTLVQDDPHLEWSVRQDDGPDAAAELLPRLEELAAKQHTAWCVNRKFHGWRPWPKQHQSNGQGDANTERNDAARLHPHMRDCSAAKNGDHCVPAVQLERLVRIVNRLHATGLYLRVVPKHAQDNSDLHQNRSGNDQPDSHSPDQQHDSCAYRRR